MRLKVISCKINNLAFKSLDKPIRLDEALVAKQIDGKKFDVNDAFINTIKQNETLASTPIIDLIGEGSSAIAFETEDNKVLKLTNGNHYPFGRPMESFDVPIYKQGKVRDIHYYFEEKLMQHNMSEGFVEIMRDMIKQKGYKPYDLEYGATHQIGLSGQGKLYLLDPECARCKTIFHALRNKFKEIKVNRLFSFRFSKALHK